MVGVELVAFTEGVGVGRVVSTASDAAVVGLCVDDGVGVASSGVAEALSDGCGNGTTVGVGRGSASSPPQAASTIVNNIPVTARDLRMDTPLDDEALVID
jgi:hypothetical protein